MFKYAFILGILIALPSMGGNVPKEKSCLELLLIRGEVPLSYERIDQDVETVFPHELIQKLEKIHIRAVHHDDVRGAKTLLVFNPSWLMQDTQAMTLLLETHPDGLAFPEKPGSEPGYHGVAAFINYWQYLYSDPEKNRGKVAKQITQIKRGLVQRILLELAYKYVQENGLSKNGQPPRFNLIQTNELSAFPGFGEITSAFVNLESFQIAYDKFHRNRVGSRVPFTDHPRKARLDVTRTARLLLGVDLRKLARITPMKDADTKARLKAEWVRSFIESYRHNSDQGFPLAGLFVGESETLSFSNYETIRELFSSLPAFIESVNAELKSKHLPLLTRDLQYTWAQEALIQYLAMDIRNKGWDKRGEYPFQTENADGEYYLNPLADLVRDAKVGHKGITLFVLGIHVRQKLQSR
jgi:hypothetical protein